MARQLKCAESRRVGETERQTEKHSRRGGQRGRNRLKNTVAERDREGELDKQKTNKQKR